MSGSNDKGKLPPGAVKPPERDYVVSIEKVSREKPAPTGLPAVAASAAQLASGGRPPVIANGGVIGRDIETGREIAIGEEERCGGTYILGQPRTGKSNLLVSLALNDIRSGHGLLFIDPHTDAIRTLLKHIPDSRKKDIILLDPTDRSYSFGINLLECSDSTNPLAVEETWAGVCDIFVKVWGDERGQLGVWLEKILRNCVYLLIENPEYTLVEIPLIVDEDPSFRNFLLGRIERNFHLKGFWFRDFDRLTKREKTEQVQPALSRLDVLRGNPIIRHIVGQGRTTVDFNHILNGDGAQKIVLLRMPVSLSQEVKRIVGTMILSQVVRAAFKRDTISEGDRRNFGIYCDEFQEFATPDFARLFTQTGKYKVMPTVAHQTRLGQFLPGDPNRGATLTAANKVFFTLSVADAQELAAEFAEEPPTEPRLEEEVAVTTSPVWHLLRGHTEPRISEFVEKHIRPLKDRLEDITGETEADRILRQDLLDEANQYRIAERFEAMHPMTGDFHKRETALLRAAGLTAIAKGQSQEMIALQREAQDIKDNIRELNMYLSAVMNGKAEFGTELLKDFLVTRVKRMTSVSTGYKFSDRYKENLIFYVTLNYGNCDVPRRISYRIAEEWELFEEERKECKRLAEKEYQAGREAEKQKAIESRREELSFRNECVVNPWINDEKRREAIKLRDEYLNNTPKEIKTTLWMYDFLHREEFTKKLYASLLAPRVIPDVEQRNIRGIYYLSHTTEPPLELVREWKFFCQLLSIPKYMIMVKTGQYVTKQVKTRTEADMVNEIARELVNLGNYTAHAKVRQFAGSGQRIWKGKIQTELIYVGPGGTEKTDEIYESEEARPPYLRSRADIEREIRERQKRWGHLSVVGEALPKSEGGEERRPSRGGGGSAGEERPPPRTSGADDDPQPAGEASEAASDAPPPRVSDDAGNDQSSVTDSGGASESTLQPWRSRGEETDKGQEWNIGRRGFDYRLVYRSDFTRRPGWDETCSDNVQVFINDGYYYMGLFKQNNLAFVHPEIVMDNFIAQADCELVMEDNPNLRCTCGIVFSAKGSESFCTFEISRVGNFGVTGSLNRKNKHILEWDGSEYLIDGNRNNTLMIAKVGKQVTIWINGHDVGSAADNWIGPGYVGLLVSNGGDYPTMQARFKNFEVYAIE